MSKVALFASALLALSVVTFASADIIVLVDYSQDTNNFFDTAAKRAAMQAAADRWGRIIQSNLGAVGPNGNGNGPNLTPAGWRIGFNHPGTGASFQVSTALNQASDPLGSSPANVYGFGGLPANTWIIYAGGRPLTSAAVGGSGTGLNFTDTFTDPNGPFHRGVMPVSAASPQADIPVWGGVISFNTNQSWHFNPAIQNPDPVNLTDFYSIAMHELGHVLGLSIGFNQFNSKVVGNTFTGANAVAAYNADNGTNVTSLNLAGSGNLHWANNTYDSRIFAGGGPNYVGTVGAGNLQDLLMEPIADFSFPIRRFEATNVDVAALKDLGWSVVGVPELSTNVALLGLLAGAGYVYTRRRQPAATPAETPAAVLS